jgi:hypothetical protein
MGITVRLNLSESPFSQRTPCEVMSLALILDVSRVVLLFSTSSLFIRMGNTIFPAMAMRGRQKGDVREILATIDSKSL